MTYCNLGVMSSTDVENPSGETKIPIKHFQSEPSYILHLAARKKWFINNKYNCTPYFEPAKTLILVYWPFRHVGG